MRSVIEALSELNLKCCFVYPFNSLWFDFFIYVRLCICMYVLGSFFQFVFV